MEDALPSAEPDLEMSSQTAQRELENLPTCIPIEPGWVSGFLGETGDRWMVQEARVAQDKVCPAWLDHSEGIVSPKSR